MLLLVTGETVPVLVPPPARVMVTVPPLEVRLFPAASFACTVSVTNDPEATVEEEMLTVVSDVDAAPGVTTSVGNVDEIAVPPIVPVIVVAVPARTPVKVAV